MFFKCKYQIIKYVNRRKLTIPKYHLFLWWAMGAMRRMGTMGTMRLE
jgi:hypothetical protein